MKTRISLIENKIPDDSSLVTTTVLNTKLSDTDNKIPDHAKYITTEEFNNSRAENFAARLKEASLVRETDIDNKLISFTSKITSNKTKYLEEQKKLNSLITKDYNFFLGILKVMMDLKTHLIINQM